MAESFASRMAVLPVPACDDNYVWLIHDGKLAAAIDPGAAQPVLDALAQHALSLAAILLTHHHHDHVDGVAALTARFGCPVFGPRGEAIDGVTHPVGEGDDVCLPGLALRLAVLDVPGHTRGHIAYVAPQRHWLFSGDTLFGAGCGRLLEGAPQHMLSSLCKLAALPDHTAVYCAHEYTLANLAFAHEADPGNRAVTERMHAEQVKREHGLPTLPSTIAIEKSTNPFLRTQDPAIIERLRACRRIRSTNAVDVFAALREWKDNFR